MSVNVHHIKTIEATIMFNEARSYQINLMDIVRPQGGQARIGSTLGLIGALFTDEVMSFQYSIYCGDWN